MNLTETRFNSNDVRVFCASVFAYT